MASYQIQQYPKHHRRIGELLDVWDEHGYYNSQYINKLRESAENAANSDPTKSEHAEVEINGNALVDSSRAPLKDAPFVMPATHGDPSTAYYDLPAGNMMPHIVPNSAIPIHPKLIKPLQFVAGPADESLVNALKDFMKEVECIGGLEDDFDEANLRDIDELGQIIIKDLVSGEITGGDGYYGWSRSFCQKMKRRKASKGLPDPARRARNDSPDRGVSLRKRKRHGYSESSSSRSRSRGRLRSYNRSRSRSPAILPTTRYGDRDVSYSRSRSHSRSISRSRSPPQRYRSLRSRSRSRSNSRSRSKSYSPPRDVPRQPPSSTYNPGATSGHAQGPSPPPPFPGPFGRGFPLGPGGIPIPPPPPHNHTGTWPPPPPPIPPGMNFIPQPGQFPPFPGFVPPHLPPPPSGPRGFPGPATGSRGFPGQVPQTSGAWGHQQQQQQQGGHGGYGGYGSGGLPAGNGQGRGRGGARGGYRS